LTMTMGKWCHRNNNQPKTSLQLSSSLTEWSCCNAVGWLWHFLGSGKGILNAVAILQQSLLETKHPSWMSTWLFTKQQCYGIVVWILRLWCSVTKIIMNCYNFSSTTAFLSYSSLSALLWKV
jgi:hypothetical protein